MSDSPEPQPPTPETPPPKISKPAAADDSPKGREERPSDSLAEEMAPATERPVPSRRQAPLPEAAAPSAEPAAAKSQYILTVDDATGYVTEVQRLDQHTGERRPLTNEEYALALTYAALGASGHLVAGGSHDTFSALPDQTAGIAQAYCAGALDYLNALTRLTNASS